MDFAHRGDNAIIGIDRPGTGANLPVVRAAVEAQHAFLFDLGAGRFGTVEEHAVQINARVNEQRARQLHLEGTGSGRGEHGIGDNLFGRVVFQQIGILRIRFIGDAATAWFFPCELFIKDDCSEAGAGQTFAAVAPAGPPPRTATVFIGLVPVREDSPGLLPDLRMGVLEEECYYWSRPAWDSTWNVLRSRLPWSLPICRLLVRECISWTCRSSGWDHPWDET